MRGRVAAVLLLSLFPLLPSAADCSFTAGYSGQFRATVYDVSVDGNYVWSATGYGVQLLEASASGPRVRDAVALTGSTRVVAAKGDGIAYAGSGSVLYVLRRSGNTIELVKQLSAPGTINDIVVTPTHLFVATREGIAHYDILSATSPIRTSAILTTSRPNVTSLSLQGSTLYAADGDASVNVYNISVPSLPQRTGTFDALPRASAVHATGDGFVFVSDDVGQNMDVFTANGAARLARVPQYGATSVAATAGGAFFVAGGDRTLRAISVADPSKPAELFERTLVPAGGTANGIFDLARSGNTLYVAAGDIGLLTFDVSTLAPPFPLISHGGGATTSAHILEGSVPRAYFSSADGTITETTLELASARTSSSAAPSIIHDSRGGDLLLASGNKVSLFSLSGTTFETTFRADVKQAVYLDGAIVALLTDASAWRVEVRAGATPEQIKLNDTAKFNFLARSSQLTGLAELKEDGTTVIHTQSNKYSVEGLATGGLAMNATHAAIFTFRGLNLIDLTTGAITVLPSSTNVLPKQLRFAGTDLLVLGERSLTVWDTATRTLTRSHTLPANAISMHAAAQRAAIATDEGMLVINYAAKLPDLVAEPNVNRYYTKALTGRDRLHLFGADGVDIYSTVRGLAPSFVAAVNEPGLIDAAATRELLFTLAGDGKVTAYSNAGVPVATAFVSVGPDSQPEAIFTAGEAVWVTVSSGCQSGACTKNSVILDPRTLNTAGMLNGGVVDISVSGTTAYAILDLPRELVSFDISRPLVPTAIKTITAPANAKSILAGEGEVFVAATDNVYTYSRALQLTNTSPQAMALSTPQLELAGDCAIVIGYSEHPEYLGPAPLREVPSLPRSIAATADRVYILTEHSIEVWAQTAPPPAKKRRSVR